MPLLEEGRVAVKKLGRDAGEKAVVVKVIDKNFVMIRSHSRPKERKCNVKHLEFLSQKVNPSNASEVGTLLEIKPKQQNAPADSKKGKKAQGA